MSPEEMRDYEERNRALEARRLELIAEMQSIKSAMMAKEADIASYAIYQSPEISLMREEQSWLTKNLTEGQRREFEERLRAIKADNLSQLKEEDAKRTQNQQNAKNRILLTKTIEAMQARVAEVYHTAVEDYLNYCKAHLSVEEYIHACNIIVEDTKAITASPEEILKKTKEIYQSLSELKKRFVQQDTALEAELGLSKDPA